MQRNKLFTADELERYCRQMLIPGFGKRGQYKLKQAHVVVAGAGGLGSISSMYLAAAGVGKLTIIDNQKVELSNLNRQLLHWLCDVDRPKTASAAEKLLSLNPSVAVEPRQVMITEKNVDSLVSDADVVVDGMDNYPTRFLLNDACVRAGKPFIHGAVKGMVGQMTTLIPGKSPCLRCIIPEVPAAKSVFPVLGAAPGMIGCLQAMEAVKYITGVGDVLAGKMLLFNGQSMTFDIVEVCPDPDCPVCGKKA